MLAMEDLLCELSEDINEQGLPPGFRFHPTDEELITFYLASKVFNGSFCGVDIAEIDLNRCEPWDLPGMARMGKRECYFFSMRDRKYPTGLRTNRATGAGYWKATGKDREVHSASSGALLGMKKTLVFYKGRAPRGEKTKWVMHEYRLDGHFSSRHTNKEEWVICRIHHKIGEKKNPVFQGQNYPLGLEDACAWSPTTGTLPPLLETANATATTTVLESQSHNKMQMQMQALQNQNQSQNPSLIHHRYQNNNDLKMLINPIAFPMNGFQPSFSPTPSNPTPTPTTIISSKNNPPYPIPPPPILFNSHQQTTTVPKQCKTEPNFSSLFQLSDTANLRWDTDKVDHHEPYPNPLYSGMGFGGIGFPSAASDSTTLPEMPTSMGMGMDMGMGFINRASIQTSVDPPIRSLTAESSCSWPLH